MDVLKKTSHLPRPGETAPPAGLVAGLRKSNRMQDIMLEEMQVGETKEAAS
jgi:hypothetical protein